MGWLEPCRNAHRERGRGKGVARAGGVREQPLDTGICEFLPLLC